MAKIYPCGGIGKHLGDCDCADAPRKREKASSGGDSGKKAKNHRHVYTTVKTTKGPVARERQGLRWVKYQTTFYFEHCSEAGCPQPDRVVPHTQYL